VRRVLHSIYDGLWLAAAVFGLPWLLWRSHTRPGFGAIVLDRLGRGVGAIPERGERPRVMVHGVSVGEVKGALPVVRELERTRPDLEVVISTSTETGREVARAVFPDHVVVNFPVDLTFVVRRFLRRVDPASVILVELEIWPNFLRVANRMAIPVAVVNGRITADSFRSYRWFKGLLPQFNRISLFCAQGREYTQRFLQLHVDPERVIETGNVKADGLAIGRVAPPQELRELLGPEEGQPVFVAGSTHHGEERMLLDAAREALPGWRVILVPRHPKRANELASDLEAAGFAPQRLTALRGGETPDPQRPVMVDTIGELEAVYGLADLVFVGGSLVPHGGQNMLEPAAQGLAVLTGPNLQNFSQEARFLEAAGALEILGEPEALAGGLAHLAGDADLRARMGAAGMAATKAQQGAARKTVEALQETCLPGR
jgi:3-deoxy-D-manno-octulosonic-acid transferase